MGEVIAEVLGEILAEVIELALSRFMPKWIRIVVLTILICILELVVFVLAQENNVLFVILSIFVFCLWLFFVNKILKVKFKKMLYAKIDEDNEFIGKRSASGEVSGRVKLSSLSLMSESVMIYFRKDEMLFKSYKKESEIFIDEQKIDFMKKLIKDEDMFLQSIVNKARKNMPDGSHMILKRVIWDEGKDITISYVFKERDTRKSYIVKESLSYS